VILCKDCKHHGRIGYPYSLIMPDRCMAIVVDPVRGSHAPCYIQRMAGGPCGPDANLFERKVGLWERFTDYYWGRSG